MAARPKDRQSKYTQETIQISLVRSITTTGATSGGKNFGTQSSGQTVKLSESRESVKDSTTSYSSSDTEPISLSDTDEQSSADEEASGYSDEDYSDTDPTDPSHGTSSYTYQSTSRTTDATGTNSTNLSEMPTHKRSSRYRALSVNNPSSEVPSKSAKNSSDGTSYGTTNTSGTTSYTTSTPNTTTIISSHGPTDSNKTLNAPPDPSTKLEEPINENEYIRAQLTLPTNEVISILMRKDQNLGNIFNPLHDEKKVNETGDSNHHSKQYPKVGIAIQQSNHQSTNQNQGGGQLVKTKAVKSFGNIKVSKPFSKIIKKSSNNNVNIQRGTKDDKTRESLDEKEIVQTSLVKDRKSDKPKESKEIPDCQGITRYNNTKKSVQIEGIDTKGATVEQKSDDKATDSFRMVSSRNVERYVPQPISFNLPSLPKLTTDKSVSFKINTELIKDKRKGKSSFSFRKLQDQKKLTKKSIKKENPNQVYKTSSMRCPQFIRFDVDSKREISPKAKSARKNEIPFNDSTFDVEQFSRNKNRHKLANHKLKPNPPLQIINSNKILSDKNTALPGSRPGRNTAMPNSCPTCSVTHFSLLSLPGSSQRSLISKNTVYAGNIDIHENVGDEDCAIRQTTHKGDCQGQCDCAYSNRFDCQSPEQQQKTHKDKPHVCESGNRQNYRQENLSPPGITRNYVRFYEANMSPEQDSTKYNFQVIRNKFESQENSVEKSEKKQLGNRNIPFRFANLCRKFSSSTRLNKCICHVERSPNHSVKQLIKGNHKGISQVRNAKEAFNNLLQEIVNTVERKKSQIRINNARSKPKNVKDIKKVVQNNTDTDLCTFCKLNDNDTEFKQLQLIFRTVKRAYDRKMRNKAKKPGLLKEMYELSKEEHSSNIGQHMSQIYLKCFSKVDHTPYSQNDFVNIRKVVDFFLKYLVFEYKYLHLYKNVAMKNIIYSVYAKISQHHFRLKHHLSTSSELDPQNNPWPVKVYDQLTKFNILVNSNSSNTNYKESNTKLRPSFSTHSEHSIKYFAIDYFLKLLKIIVIEGQEGNDIHGESQKAAVSERATASSFNSHHYCHLESSTKTSSHCSKHSLHHEVTPRDIASYGTVGDVLTNSVETDNESAVNTTRFQSVKGKLKRFKKRKTRRSFIEKQLNRSANTKQAHVKQEPNLSRFELNRYVFNKTVKGKQLKSFQSLKTKSKIEGTKTITTTSNSKEKVKTNNSSMKIPDQATNEITGKEQSMTVEIPPTEEKLLPPSPPKCPPPQKNEYTCVSADLIDEVSNLVNKIVRFNKNVNLDKIKQQINFILEKNSADNEDTNKEEHVEEKVIPKESGRPTITRDNPTTSKLQSMTKQKEIEIPNKSATRNESNKNIKGIRNSLIEQIKQNVHGLQVRKTELIYESNHSETSIRPKSIHEQRKSLNEDVKLREIMIPVNMIKNPHREEIEWRRDSIQRETKNEKDIQKPRFCGPSDCDKRCNRKCKEKSGVFQNQHGYNCVVRNKVISNKINQKILELTKNVSLENTKPINVHEESVQQQRSAGRHQPKHESCPKMIDNNERHKCSPVKFNAEVKKSNEKFDVVEKKNTTSKNKTNEDQTMKQDKMLNKSSQKTPVIISNDDLFFTNRRRLSIFNRPFHSILGFESDRLSDERYSDDDLSIHELYVNKPYCHHESKSCTNHIDHENVRNPSRLEDSKHKISSAQDTKDKCLTKKQLEVFNKLRTMYQEELDMDKSNSNQAITKPPPEFGKSVKYTTITETKPLFRGINRSQSKPIGRKSKSQSCIFENLAHFSIKNYRSSETVLGLD